MEYRFVTVELLKPLRNTIHVCAFARLHIYIFRESYHSNQSQKTLLNDLKCFILSCMLNIRLIVLFYQGDDNYFSISLPILLIHFTNTTQEISLKHKMSVSWHSSRPQLLLHEISPSAMHLHQLLTIWNEYGHEHFLLFCDRMLIKEIELILDYFHFMITI